ncbi:cysteine hydrolase [Tessaracoccus defluvii]|uniref:Cysteine hydrolase n=1 Tax=Tessaracoccus defluvii TaxID=1285901 RepID=A0A7H0H4F1_9ACTN|nr:cysteine hydrolase [Tessaracoccus defluvii]QNP55417.1 cysteine hydrolase [Tessaracoccus defluvii]
MNPATTALVLIEFQNDFTTPGGTLHDAVKTVMESTDTLNNAVEAAAAIREAGGVVLHVPITFAPGYDEITRHPYGILKGVVDSTSFVRGSWGAEICEQLTPVEGDIIIEGKRGLDAFGSTNLDFVLRSKGIETVALAGFLTNCCVESTMRSAYEKGFEVLTITDAVGATSPEEHANAIQYDYPMFSKPMSTDEFVSSLSEDKELADSSRGY